MPFDTTEAAPAYGIAHSCPKCSLPFVPKRKNQTNCSPKCQKNATLGPRTVALSITER